jgi:hypothetical protein
MELGGVGKGSYGFVGITTRCDPKELTRQLIHFPASSLLFLLLLDLRRKNGVSKRHIPPGNMYDPQLNKPVGKLHQLLANSIDQDAGPYMTLQSVG